MYTVETNQNHIQQTSTGSRKEKLEHFPTIYHLTFPFCKGDSTKFTIFIIIFLLIFVL